ncbi:hypothetical protein LOCC1_G004104 [Lachnellula occidentalis]|uniref:Uncharacterized protein n=1 Tax=Lachnellula occidentalis TaxID=215460 RepID=A0A8H8RXK3_9HELO|nr:hypothetical protein LOCC1_G004104 [Lachnellula occidentalis]
MPLPLPPRLFPGDEELGKRDDDHKPGMGLKTPLGMFWQHRRLSHGPQRRNFKRIALGVLAFIALYYFFKKMPTDLENPRQRPSYSRPGTAPAPVTDYTNPKALPPTGQGSGSKTVTQAPEESLHSFNGPIKFYQLASSLHAVSNTKGADLINQNVLFAAASVKSAATLLPIACDMAVRARNFVHFAFMGRDDISMDILKAVNGITKECRIIFHDARPDFSVQSSDFRMEVSTFAGFNHINTFVHPQATFIDGSGEEEPFFLKGLKARAASLQRTVIELPDNAEQYLMWVTLLDSASLSAWNKVSIDIVIHAQRSASGSLMRLLNSLKKADFFSSAPPRLTIELPHQIDTPTKNYLEQFKWPPKADHNTGNLLTLHHRIPQHGLSPDENSIRFLEAFWPADSFWSHVLVLSPQAELSPLFFHYLKYTILEYKYSRDPSVHHKNLMGISLDLPSTYLNDSSSFIPPVTNTTVSTPFLWQAPNSNAALYFGDKWVELHDFVARLLESQHKTPTTKDEKLVSKTYPSWLEHVLKLVRTRGYSTLYPNFDADTLVTLHNDLYQLPEEFSEEDKAESPSSSGELTADPEHHLSLKHTEAALITKSLLAMLPSDGALPPITEMQSLSWDGQKIDAGLLVLQAQTYSKAFRREIGGCGVSAKKVRNELSAADLFCLNDEKLEAKEGDDQVDEPE